MENSAHAGAFNTRHDTQEDEWNSLLPDSILARREFHLWRTRGAGRGLQTAPGVVLWRGSGLRFWGADPEVGACALHSGNGSERERDSRAEQGFQSWSESRLLIHSPEGKAMPRRRTGPEGDAPSSSPSAATHPPPPRRFYPKSTAGVLTGLFRKNTHSSSKMVFLV